jgi:hypothetical protein
MTADDPDDADAAPSAVVKMRVSTRSNGMPSTHAPMTRV